MTGHGAGPADHLGHARRIVIKVGSSLLIEREQRAPRDRWLAGLAQDIVGLRQRGAAVLVVSSGAVALGCNIHDDMRGYIRVVDTPYAGKTDNNGMLSLDAVPNGSATITVWHPRLRAPGNEMRRTVTISGNSNRHRLAVNLR